MKTALNCLNLKFLRKVINTRNKFSDNIFFFNQYIYKFKYHFISLVTSNVLTHLWQAYIFLFSLTNAISLERNTCSFKTCRIVKLNFPLLTCPIKVSLPGLITFSCLSSFGGTLHQTQTLRYLSSEFV